MIQKGIALILLWLMTVVVAVSQPGLRYCLCIHEISVGECQCPGTVHQEGCTSACDDGSCDCSSRDTSGPEDQTCFFNLDCSVILQMELADFLGSSPHQNISLDGPDSPSFPIPFVTLDCRPLLHGFVHEIRGSPPPLAKLGPSVPLRVRYSVFLV